MPESTVTYNKALRKPETSAMVQDLLDMGHNVFNLLHPQIVNPLLECDSFWKQKCAYNLGHVSLGEFASWRKVWLFWMFVDALTLYYNSSTQKLRLSEWFWEQRVRRDLSEEFGFNYKELLREKTWEQIWHRKETIKIKYVGDFERHEDETMLRKKIQDYLEEKTYLETKPAMLIQKLQDSTYYIDIYGLPLILGNDVAAYLTQ